MTKILFLDESGDHNLTTIDQQHPIFVLGGIVSDYNYAMGEMTEKLNQFKRTLFGTTDIVLHTADFTRQKNGFERIKEKPFCEAFYHHLNQLIAELDITILACAIKKEEHMQCYGTGAIDPYHLSLNVLAERFCFTIGKDAPKGKIIAESRDTKLDRLLNLAWSDIKISGTRYMQASDVNASIESLNLKCKEDRIAGLEIADAVVTPIARSLLGRTSRINLDIIKQKMRKDSQGNVSGYGLVVLPKKKS